MLTHACIEALTSLHANTHIHINAQNQPEEISSYLLPESIFLFFAKQHFLCFLCALPVDVVCPWPRVQDERHGRPFNFVVCSLGQNNNCSSGWTCQAHKRSRRNQECSTEANKAAAISCPSHQRPRGPIQGERERERQIERKRNRKREKLLWNDPADPRTWLHWFMSTDG